MNLRTPIHQVRGLGAAKSGTGHWWAQRVSAVALVPLVVWFLTSMVVMVGADHATVVIWMRAPLVAIILVLFLTAVFYHLKLGVQVIIEDYVHAGGLKIAALLANIFFCFALGVSCVFAVLKVSFGG